MSKPIHILGIAVKAAGVQLSPVLYSREGTVDKVTRKIYELGQQGVQFATFPETVVPYYPYFSFIQAPYQIPSSAAGVPGISLPMGLNSEGLPLGLELDAPAGHDCDLLALARRVEQVIGCVTRPM